MNLSRRKESDLRGAIDNDQENSNRNEDKSTSKKDEEKIDDYQLTRAFDLILAINLVNKNLQTNCLKFHETKISQRCWYFSYKQKKSTLGRKEI